MNCNRDVVELGSGRVGERGRRDSAKERRNLRNTRPEEDECEEDADA